MEGTRPHRDDAAWVVISASAHREHTQCEPQQGERPAANQQPGETCGPEPGRAASIWIRSKTMFIVL
jgi:hypothetical protein